MQPSPEVMSRALGIVEWLRVALEAAGAVTIAAGAIAAALVAARTIHHDRHPDFTAARLELARFLALALEFQLAADVLETAISPDWATIGHLAAIGTIRTALNYFLDREMRGDRRDLIAAGE
jgi:uncharacterized membrane protein